MERPRWRKGTIPFLITGEGRGEGDKSLPLAGLKAKEEIFLDKHPVLLDKELRFFTAGEDS
jgi:hypothetical protein